MFIRTNPCAKVLVAEPATATLATNTKKQGRNCVILTNLTAATDFKVHLGAAASATNWTFLLKAGEPAVVIDNWTGVITCSPAPAAGEIHVAEVMGSSFGTT